MNTTVILIVSIVALSVLALVVAFLSNKIDNKVSPVRYGNRYEKRAMGYGKLRSNRTRRSSRQKNVNGAWRNK
jgi:hypothetical protein